MGPLLLLTYNKHKEKKMGINFVPALALFGEDFFSLSSNYFITHNHDLVKVRVRNLVDDVKSIALDNLKATIPAEAFTNNASEDYRTVIPKQQCQININRMWSNLCPRNGIELVQEFYRYNYPTFSFYAAEINTVSKMQYGPDKINPLCHWKRQPGYSEEDVKSGAVQKKDGPYVMLLHHINGKPWRKFSDNELREMIGSFADDRCKIESVVKKGIQYRTVCKIGRG